MLLLEKAKTLFPDRKALVHLNVENESAQYFDKLDAVEDKFLKDFCTQVVLSTMADAYDFFYYVQSEYNIFYSHIQDLTPEVAAKLYKWMGMYHAVCCNHEADFLETKPLRDALSHVFGWSRYDKKMFRYFLNLRKNCSALFDVLFLKKMVLDLFDCPLAGPTLALCGHLFYNAHNAFIGELKHALEPVPV